MNRPSPIILFTDEHKVEQRWPLTEPSRDSTERRTVCFKLNGTGWKCNLLRSIFLHFPFSLYPHAFPALLFCFISSPTLLLVFPPSLTLPPSSLSSLSLPSLPWPVALLHRGEAPLNSLSIASPCIFNGHARRAGISAWIMHWEWVEEKREGLGGREDRVRVWNPIKDGNRDERGLEIIEDKIKTCRGSENDGMRVPKRNRDVYFGIITALMQESVTSHLPPSSPHFICLHPGCNFTFTPRIPSSLSPSLQGVLSFLSRYFITSSPCLCGYLSSLHPSIFSPQT